MIVTCTKCGKKYRLHHSKREAYACSRCRQAALVAPAPHSTTEEALQADIELDRIWQDLRQFRTLAFVLAFLSLAFLWAAVPCILVAIFMRRWPGRCMVCLAVLVSLVPVPVGYLAWRANVLLRDGRAGLGLLVLVAGTLWIAFKTWNAIPLAREAETILRQQRARQNSSGAEGES